MLAQIIILFILLPNPKSSQFPLTTDDPILLVDYFWKWRRIGHNLKSEGLRNEECFEGNWNFRDCSVLFFPLPVTVTTLVTNTM